MLYSEIISQVNQKQTVCENFFYGWTMIFSQNSKLFVKKSCNLTFIILLGMPSNGCLENIP